VAFPGIVSPDVSALARLVIALLIVVGLLLIAVGVTYFVVKSGSLPSFFPGHVAGSTAHRSKHGIVALIVGVLVLAVGLVAATSARLQR